MSLCLFLTSCFNISTHLGKVAPTFGNSFVTSVPSKSTAIVKLFILKTVFDDIFDDDDEEYEMMNEEDMDTEEESEEENYDDESMDDLDSDDDLDDLVIIDSEEENDGELM